ncbi:MAG: hypothetical protein MUF00_15825 [Gemmatimonadaceae bacterium]|jgi:anti-sigma factor RsiW|nr:hypothetical protein [Gemmatimonadaceae bacterium]
MSTDEAGQSRSDEGPMTSHDLLPDLASGRLDDVTTSRLRRAVAGDPALAEELSIIEAVRASAETPAIDLARIVAALPKPPASAAPVIDLATRRAERASMTRWQWRAAAAVLVMIAGAGGVFMRGGSGAGAPAQMTASADLAAGTLASAVEIDALSDEELADMLTRLERFDGASLVDTTDSTEEEQ